MIVFFIGHRGVGKTSLLQRLSKQIQNTYFFDLDAEIEKQEACSIEKIFLTKGESYFRQLEFSVLLNILSSYSKEKHLFVSLGAGFLITDFRKKYFSELSSYNILYCWVRRDSDQKGRIFTDRPRLQESISPLQEFLQLMPKREEVYQKNADFIYTLPEGNFNLHEFESCFFSFANYQIKNFGVTWLPEEWTPKFNFLRPEFVELRTDILTQKYTKIEFLYELINTIEPTPILLSFRGESSKGFLGFKELHEKVKYIDWDMDLGEIPSNLMCFQNKLIVSLHSEKFMDGISHLKSFTFENFHIKFSPVVTSYLELNAGLAWQEQDPERRSFLPRSKDGRWQWVRTMLAGRQKLNFFRMGIGTQLDQPSVFWASQSPLFKEKFAAVLGDPVQNSYSPSFHRQFFKNHNIPYYSIRLAKEEVPEALPVLKKLGLAFASITSPLKNSFNNSPVNTMAQNSNLDFEFSSTDAEGFYSLISDLKLDISHTQFFVWGGDGVLPAIKKIIPHAVFFSARTGQVKFSDVPPPQSSKAPVVLIWAAPGSVTFRKPNFDFRPNMLIDLNYASDSLAKEFAVEENIPYVSGLKMFEGQALMQQEFWRKFI